jgi:hypothetical protein
MVRAGFLILLVSLVFVNSLFAAGGTMPGSGTQTDPYLIEDTDDFFSFIGDSAYWNKDIRLESDISLAGTVFIQAPIAPDTNNSNSTFEGTKFSGSFDGNGYVISNLTIDVFQGTPSDQSNDFLALFGSVAQYAKLNNVALENVQINAGNYSQHVGALCGKCDYMSYVRNCYASGLITGQQYTAWAGGLIGVTQAIINNSSSTVDISAGNHVGGFCAELAVGGKTKNCWASGSVEEINPLNPYSHLGGFCGRSSATNAQAIYKCYSTGSVKASAGDTKVGGFCGDDSQATISNCFWDKETSGITTSPSATGKTTAEMKKLETFKSNNWDFTRIWQMNLGSYPKIRPVYYIPGDLNTDKAVNILDLAILASNWLEQTSP